MGLADGPAGSGIGLRWPHVAEVVATRPAVGWMEVHAENYMGGGLAIETLERLRRDYPLSIHGVGLSLGTAEGLDAAHLERFATLIDRVQPEFRLHAVEQSADLDHPHDRALFLRARGYCK